MRRIRYSLIAIVLAIPLPCLAQSGAPSSQGASATADTTVPKKKKGGLFGKVKGLAGNKIVKTVAKTAACTMVPGGQLIAGAIDAADKKDAAGAAAGVASRQPGCMPGAGMLGNPAAAAQQAAAAKAGAGVSSLAGVAVPGMPVVPQGLSAEQMKQMQEHYRKMGLDQAQLQEMMANMPSGVAATGEIESPEASAVITPSLKREKGKLVLRSLPWMPGYAAIQPGSESAFGQVVTLLAAEILATSKHYKVEVKVEDQGSKALSQTLAQQRATVLIGALVNQGVPQTRLAALPGGPDKDRRVVISERKPGK